MSQGTGGEIYNTLKGWDYGNNYTHNSEDEGAMSVLQEDVETVLGLQAVVKSMLADVMMGQHAQTSSCRAHWAAVYSPRISQWSHLRQHPAQQHPTETLIWRFWRAWWMSYRATVPTVPPHHLQATHTPRAQLHRPHRHIYLNTDPDLQTDSLVKRRGSGLLAEPRGVRME